MPELVIAASPKTYMASLGVVLDAHALLGALYESNRALSDYSHMATGVRVLTVDGGPLRLAGGRTLAADGAFSSASEPRLVYLPAFEAGGDFDPDPAHAATLYDWLGERHARGAVIAAAGTGVWLLARAGLLDGAPACVEPRMVPAFRQAFPRLEIEPVRAMTPGGQVMTCGALGPEREFVIRVFGQAISPSVADWLHMCWGSSDERATAALSDPLVAKAQLWIRERFTEDFRIQDLAASLSVSHQTLIRRFREAAGMTPRRYAQGLRMHAAQMMLRDTRRTVAEISALVGYADLPTFRAVFQAHAGRTPSAFRLDPKP
jgi:transcriptional regulator GlxA family with amidase domain